MPLDVDLADFLKARRATVRPEDVGLSPAAHNRRVPGLRREEVAHLAGVSTDYYTRLEQGRHQTPSDSVLDAIAGALRLDDAERAHLYTLAQRAPASRRASRATSLGVQRVRPTVHQMLESLRDQPAFVLGRRTDVLATNRMARALLADFDAMPARDRNMTRWMILDPAARALFPDWETVAAEVVGTLRLDAGRHPDDPRVTELVGELAVKSEHFRRWWADHRVTERTHGTKHMQHPVVGTVDINYEALTLPGDPDQTLFIYTPTRTRDAEALRLLGDWVQTSTTPDPKEIPHDADR